MGLFWLSVSLCWLIVGVQFRFVFVWGCVVGSCPNACLPLPHSVMHIGIDIVDWTGLDLKSAFTSLKFHAAYIPSLISSIQGFCWPLQSTPALSARGFLPVPSAMPLSSFHRPAPIRPSFLYTTALRFTRTRPRRGSGCSPGKGTRCYACCG